MTTYTMKNYVTGEIFETPDLRLLVKIAESAIRDTRNSMEEHGRFEITAGNRPVYAIWFGIFTEYEIRRGR